MYLEISKLDTEVIKKIVILKEIPKKETSLKTEHLLQDVPMQLLA